MNEVDVAFIHEAIGGADRLQELAFEDLIGPNYSRQMGVKPAEYERYGDKWYRKSR